MRDDNTRGSSRVSGHVEGQSVGANRVSAKRKQHVALPTFLRRNSAGEAAKSGSHSQRLISFCLNWKEIITRTSQLGKSTL